MANALDFHYKITLLNHKDAAMAEQSVMTAMLNDIADEQPIHTAICIGQDLSKILADSTTQWDYFSLSDVLSLPFVKRYDIAVVMLNQGDFVDADVHAMTQCLVKMRDLFAKRLIVFAGSQDEKLLRSLGLTQLLQPSEQQADLILWQFNILNYKHVPDWFNSKFWANPENWDKFRW